MPGYRALKSLPFRERRCIGPELAPASFGMTWSRLENHVLILSMQSERHRYFVFVYQCEMPVNSASRKNSLDKSCGFVYCKVDESIRPTRAEQPV
jgi:hypothetical protein